MGRRSRNGHKKYRTATIARKEEPRLTTSTIRRPNGNPSPVTISVIDILQTEAGAAATIKVTDKEKYTYVIDELKLVGILTALILMILIVLALLLR